MYKYSTLVLLPLLLLILLGGCAKEDQTLVSIEGFEALDMPHDDGSGVMLKWKPLHRSHRIIQYNIYRGHHPDSLFMLGKIEVDPKLGVMADYLYFYDKDYLPLIEFETSPAKLKQEKHQPQGSPIYRRVPRDPQILANLLPHYDVLGEIDAKRYYHGSRQITDEEGNVSAGFRLTQFNTFYANPLQGNTYYYSVIAVKETGRHLPAAPIKSAQPVDNRPDSTAILHTAYIKDTGEFSFEWNPPLGSQDIAAWQAWLLPKSLLPLYHEEQKKNLTAPDSVFHAAWQQEPGTAKLFELAELPYWTQNFYHKSAADSVNLTASELVDYIPVLCYSDYSGYSTASLGRPLRITSSDQIPALPAFSVHDKINDKGDNLHISLGKPLAYVTLASYANRKRNKLLINYEVSENENYKVDKIRFSFHDHQGTKVGEITEHFPDKIIHLKLPKGTEPRRGIKVQTSVRLIGEKEFEAQSVSQDIVYDESARRFIGENPSFNGTSLSEYSYDLFTRNRFSPDYSPGLRMGAITRSYDHTISYESVLYQGILGYDATSKRLLTGHQFTVAVDEKTGTAFRPSLFRSVTEEYLEELENSAGGQEEYEFITGLPAYLAAKNSSGDRAWRKALLPERDRNSRSYSYQILATDGKGLWQQSDTFINEAGQTWFYPVSNWFDSTKLATLIATIVMCLMVVVAVHQARRKDLYIRPIAGLHELDNAVGRATEMGRPVMFVPGWGTLGEPCTISALMILNQIARKTAEYDVRLISPHVDYFVMPLAQEMVQTAYNEVGRPDAYNQNDIFYVSDTQFAFCAAVNGITVRERVATIFYMGYFFAEALLMTETGNQAGAIQIAGTDAVTQVPFFITTCDYTLIGEEFYAASAYLSRNIELTSMLKAQDYFKLLIVVVVAIGTLLTTLHINELIYFLPIE